MKFDRAVTVEVADPAIPIVTVPLFHFQVSNVGKIDDDREIRLVDLLPITTGILEFFHPIKGIG